jgi:phosphodiesterase/alkaline phosphatase D-like protein
LLLIVLLIGLGGLIYWQFGDQLLSFFTSSTGGTTTPTTVDTTKPVITFPVDPAIGPTSVSINWTTDELASSQVEYGEDTTYGSLEPAQPDTDPSTGQSVGVVTHSVVITGLQPTTTYHYRVKSKDAAGNEAVSADKTFTTIAVEE